MRLSILVMVLSIYFTPAYSHHQGIVTYQFLQQNIEKFIQTVHQLHDDVLVFKDYKAVAADASIECFSTCAHTWSELYLKNSSSKMSLAAKQQTVIATCSAVYALLKKFGRIFADKKEFHNQIMSFSYQDLVLKYPHLALVQLHIKAMNLLVHMSLYGSLPEQIFANIHLVSMILPGVYERSTKKWSRKLFKKIFDQTGRLITVTIKLQDHPYKKFFKKISGNWYDLLHYADKFPKNLTPVIPSECKEFVFNPYNTQLLQIIDCAMNQTLHMVQPSYYDHQNILIQELYSFYNVVQ